MKLLVVITSERPAGLEIAQSWYEAGAPGVTILRSIGIVSLRQALEHGDIELPAMTMSMGTVMAGILDNMEENGVIILSLVPDTLAETMESIARKVVEEDRPNTGICFVVDVERAFGVRDHRSRPPAG